MSKKLLGLCALALCWVNAAGAAERQCALQRYAELPVTMVQRRPVISGTINGTPVNFVVDTGAFFSVVSNDSARRLNLKMQALPAGMNIQIGGDIVQAGKVTVKELTLTGYSQPVLKNHDFLVLHRPLDEQIDGVIGQNILASNDAEFDLANGYIRFFVSQHCQDHSLAYWRNSPGYSNQVEAVMDIKPRSREQTLYIGSALLNGRKITVLFDPGVPQSITKKRLVDDMGIDIQAANVTEGGVMTGQGRKTAESWVIQFKTLELGGETIRNAKLRVSSADFFRGADLILGADFFLSHRVYIANRQNKIYFTYNGGPVFDLRVRDEGDPPSSAQSGSEAGPAQQVDAAELRRRGTAFLARMDMRNALASLEQAVALDPDDSENHYQLALAQLAFGKNELALVSLNKALALKPNDISILFSRGRTRLLMGDDAGAGSDFAAVEEASSDDPAYAMSIIDIYCKANKAEDVMQRLDRWIAMNPKHQRLGSALFQRCYARASAGEQFDLAIADCNAAYQQGLRSSSLFTTRGLAYYRKTHYAAAIADFQKAIKLQPKSAAALYGLGVSQLRAGNELDGQAHIKQAESLDGKIADHFKEIGIAP